MKALELRLPRAFNPDATIKCTQSVADMQEESTSQVCYLLRCFFQDRGDKSRRQLESIQCVEEIAHSLIIPAKSLNQIHEICLVIQDLAVDECMSTKINRSIHNSKFCFVVNAHSHKEGLIDDESASLH